MRYIPLLALFITLTLFSMEDEESQRCPFPFTMPRSSLDVPERPQTPKEKKHEKQLSTMTNRALSMYFENEDVEQLTFSSDLFKTVN
ncbi:hypothetical protein LCGC14_2955700, partial [marine sediment metagenome]